MAGNVSLHRELEERLADWVEREEALLFTTGYQCNIGVLSALFRPEDIVLCDGGVHASLLDGCRLAGATVRRFHRQRLASLTRQLYAASTAAIGLVLDAVYSMEGDLAPLEAINARLGSADVCVVVDEAHALGVFGRRGGGVASSRPAGERVTLVTGTLSKALASCGGFVAGARDLIQALRFRARSLMFSTASVPAALGAAHAALTVTQSEPERRQRALANADLLRAGFQSEGIDTGRSASAIVPAIIGEPLLALRVCQDLFANGIYAGLAVHPAVPMGRSLIRFGVMATMTSQDIAEAVEVTARIFRQHRVLELHTPVSAAKSEAGN